MFDKKYYQAILDDIKQSGLWKEERIITTPQSAQINTTQANGVLNFCANNYLGLSDNAEIKKVAKESYDKYGYGMSSVRFICGTQTIHKELECAISKFLSTEDTILYSSCFDTFANFDCVFLHVIEPVSSCCIYNYFQVTSLSDLEPKKRKFITASTFSPSTCHE